MISMPVISVGRFVGPILRKRSAFVPLPDQRTATVEFCSSITRDCSTVRRSGNARASCARPLRSRRNEFLARGHQRTAEIRFERYATPSAMTVLGSAAETTPGASSCPRFIPLRSPWIITLDTARSNYSSRLVAPSGRMRFSSCCLL